jgi:hypothetical protein
MKNFFSLPIAEAGVISDATPLSEILLNVLQFLLSVVGIVAIIAIVITGIRYLFASDTNQATSVKRSFTAIVIGLVLVMGAIIIVWQIGKFLT